MHTSDIVLPETKPETEWVRGRALQKMSPTTTHAMLQTGFVLILAPWAKGRGRVGTEWRFRIAPDGGVRRPLVPDVAYVALERLRALSASDRESPPFAPDVAIEILSPDDRRADVESKIDVYLRGGSDLVVVVDPRAQTIRTIDHDGPKSFCGDDTFRHDALPGFAFVVVRFFEEALL